MKTKKEETKKDVKTAALLSYADILSKYSIIRAVQLVCKQKELPAELKSKVMDVRFAFKKHKREFDEKIKDGQEDLKPAGFDDRMKESQEFEEKMLNKYPGKKELEPEMLTDNLSPEEEEMKVRHEAFMAEFRKWNKECEKFASDKLQEKVGFEEKKFTRKEFDEILDVNSSERYELETEAERGSIHFMARGSMAQADFAELFYEEFVA